MMYAQRYAIEQFDATARSVNLPTYTELRRLLRRANRSLNQFQVGSGVVFDTTLRSEITHALPDYSDLSLDDPSHPI